MMNEPGYHAGAGGKFVTNRGRQRLATTPYDPPPPPPPPSSSRSPNCFTRVLIPSARAIASGAVKILSSTIFSESESSSSEDLDSVSEDDIDNVNEQESPHGQINASNKREKEMSMKRKGDVRDMPLKRKQEESGMLMKKKRSQKRTILIL